MFNQSITPQRLREAASHWRKLAEEARTMGEFNKEIGIDPFYGTDRSASTNQARTYDRTAQALDLEAETGKYHCVACLEPVVNGRCHCAVREGKKR